MTPKEKAKQLVDKFEPYVIRYTQDDVVGYLSEETPILEYQKQCALIAVDELIEELEELLEGDERPGAGVYYLWKYYQEVKQEIELL